MKIRNIGSGVLRRLDLPYLQTPEWKTWWKLRRALRNVPRYKAGTVNIDNWDIEYSDAASFLSAFETIVVQHSNDFRSDSSEPVILDCGANIGVSVIYFKRLFPGARIVAFEPDANVCSLLRRNLEANQIEDVEVVEAAVWKEDGEMDFFSEGADAGRVEELGQEVTTLVEGSVNGSRTRIKTIALKNYLNREVDFIKLDVEGAESVVLDSCSALLRNVRSMIVEFHVTNARPRELGIVMNALADANFKVSCNSYGQKITLMNRDAIVKNSVEFDQYLLLEAWR